MVTPTEESQYPELVKLVQEIKQGKRIVLFPVGGASFIAVKMLTMLSLAMLTVTLLNVIGSDWEIGTQASAQMFLVLFGTLCIVPPGILITRGKKKLRHWFIFLSTFIAISSAISIVIVYLINIEKLQVHLIFFFISLAFSSLAAYFSRSAEYLAFTYFYYFLHKKD